MRRIIDNKIISKLLLLLVLSLFLITSTVSALTPEQKKVIQSGSKYFNIESSSRCRPASQQSSSVSGSIYMLGDSITAGAQLALENVFAANDLTISRINGVVGRAISAPGQGSETGLQALDNDASSVASSGGIVIALGTNSTGADTNGVTEMINKARGLNQDAKIYWVNIFSPGAPNKESFNSVLNTLSVSLSFTVINASAANIAVSSDSVHPTPEGQVAFASIVANTLSGGKTENVSASGCVCTPSGASGNMDRDARYREVWGYFTNNKGLSEEATAGLMGNLEAESGIDPQNTQNDAPAPDGPEIPIEIIRNRWGYGIAQWTTAGRQQNLINYARETNRSTGDLGLQLDFLWKELSESYAGVLTTLQTPNVSLEEASDQVLLRFEIPRSVIIPPSTQEQRQETMNARRAIGAQLHIEFSGQNISSSLGGGCDGLGATIDLESTDTTNIPCGGNTQDAGPTDGYMNGRQYRIRLCLVGGTTANSQIAASLERLLADSSAAGVNISFGSFRSMQTQISMYVERCQAQGLTPTPGPYPKTSHGEYQSCDSIAPPGFSNHQMGFAIDVSCDGNLIPRYHPDANNNTCYRWLVKNSVKYGLYEFGKGEGNNTSGAYEAWHWSVDGN